MADTRKRREGVKGFKSTPQSGAANRQGQTANRQTARGQRVEPKGSPAGRQTADASMRQKVLNRNAEDREGMRERSMGGGDGGGDRLQRGAESGVMGPPTRRKLGSSADPDTIAAMQAGMGEVQGAPEGGGGVQGSPVEPEARSQRIRGVNTGIVNPTVGGSGRRLAGAKPDASQEDIQSVRGRAQGAVDALGAEGVSSLGASGRVAGENTRADINRKNANEKGSVNRAAIAMGRQGRVDDSAGIIRKDGRRFQQDAEGNLTDIGADGAAIQGDPGSARAGVSPEQQNANVQETAVPPTDAPAAQAQSALDVLTGGQGAPPSGQAAEAVGAAPGSAEAQDAERAAASEEIQEGQQPVPPGGLDEGGNFQLDPTQPIQEQVDTIQAQDEAQRAAENPEPEMPKSSLGAESPIEQADARGKLRRGQRHHLRKVGLAPEGMDPQSAKDFERKAVRDMDLFGEYPGMDDPHAPPPPIRPGKHSFNAHTGKFVTPEGQVSVLERGGSATSGPPSSNVMSVDKVLKGEVRV